MALELGAGSVRSGKGTTYHCAIPSSIVVKLSDSEGTTQFGSNSEKIDSPRPVFARVGHKVVVNPQCAQSPLSGTPAPWIPVETIGDRQNPQ
jgi:hypothetical protein